MSLGLIIESILGSISGIDLGIDLGIELGINPGSTLQDTSMCSWDCTLIPLIALESRKSGNDPVDKITNFLLHLLFHRYSPESCAVDQTSYVPTLCQIKLHITSTVFISWVSCHCLWMSVEC